MRKLFSVLLVLCLLLQCTAITVAAETGTDEKTQVAEVTYPVAIDATNFPDSIFRDYVSEQFDTNNDGQLSQEEAEAVVEIDVNSSSISDLTGLRVFPNLKRLSCYDNQLTELDVTQNPELEYLSCDSNQLTALDVTKNPALSFLNCSYNQLSELDVSQYSALTTLYCDYNQLTSLDVSKNPELKYFYCYNNQLTALDVTQNSALNSLWCQSNQLTELDVSKNPELTFLICDDNQLASLDVTKNPALWSLSCDNIQLASLDVTKNPALTQLSCDDNQLTALDVSQNPTLKTLACRNNQLTSLDTSKNPELTELFCQYNQLTSLDATKNPALTWLDCWGNQLIELDVTQNPVLSRLLCASNQLNELDVAQNPELTDLFCGSNQLTSLDVTKNPALTELSCGQNQLTSLDVTKNPALTELSCGGNQLTALELSSNSALTTVYVSYQYVKASALRHTGEDGTPYWTIDFSALVGAENLSRVTLSDDTVSRYGASYDAATGIATFTTFPKSSYYTRYLYDTGRTDTQTLMEVNLSVVEDVPATDHTPVAVAAVDATCTTAGNTAYWYCTDCGKYFSDAECTVETTLEAVTIPATGHTEVTDDAVPPTCTETGLTEGSHCSTCGEVIVEQTVIPATGHNYTYSDNGDGTHTGTCSACGDTTTEDHTYVDGNCICGAVEAPITPKDENLQFFNVSLSLQECIQFTYIAKYTGVLNNYDSYYVAFSRNDSKEGLVENQDAGYQYSTKYHCFSYSVWSMQLNDEITATLYGVKDGVVYEGQTIVKSVRDYIEEKFSAVNDATKSVYANMLQYGAMAQVNFSYDTENLVTAGLSADITSYITSEAPATVNQTASTSNGLTGVTLAQNALGTQDAVKLQYVLDIGTNNVDDLYAVATWVNEKGETVTKRYEGSQFTQQSKYYVVIVDGLNAVNGKIPVSLTVYNATTNEAVSETFTCSIQSQVYARQNATNNTTAKINALNLMNALMNYYNACETLFG